MVFGKKRFPWLDEHKVTENLNSDSFDPFGRAFYFYIKQRQPEDEKNIKDVFIEVMYTREETKFEKENSKKQLETPVFNKPNFEANNDIPFGNIEDAFGIKTDSC